MSTQCSASCSNFTTTINRSEKWFQQILAKMLLKINSKYDCNCIRNEKSVLFGLTLRDKFCFAVFMTVWTLITLLALYLNATNVNWKVVPAWLGILFVFVTTLLHANVFESVLIAFAAILIGGHRRSVKVAPSGHLSLLINYNILAVFKQDIDETMRTMYRTYMGNLSFKTSCVLVSATGDENLKEHEIESCDKYRKLIYKSLYDEGVHFANGNLKLVNKFRYKQIWWPNRNCGNGTENFIQQRLPKICRHFADQFMVVHRVSRVLKKCGQYQDLMLLSEGEKFAYTYCDRELYGQNARRFGEKLFHDSADADRIFGRRFDYTLVLDGDTFVPQGHSYELLCIAAAHPEKGIIQPGIKIVNQGTDTIFMRIESLRQNLSAATTNAMAAMLGHVSFFGKGLIKNRVYIDNLIGSRRELLEMIPVDVLSHDTYEAVCLKPLYAGSVVLVEAPCRNYITWNIRETRWNTGDIILAVHFWPKTFGRLVRWLQSMFRNSNRSRVFVRTVPKFDLVTFYVANSAVRHMAVKMLLFLYLVLRTVVTLRNPCWPDSNLTFFVLLFPKFAVYNGRNLKLIVVDMVMSFLQFSPDIFAGVLRVVVALKRILQTTHTWIPQRAVEEQFQRPNKFMAHFRELWLSILCSVLLCFLNVVQAYFKSSWVWSTDFVFVATALFLPVYCAVTSLPVQPFIEKMLQ